MGEEGKALLMSKTFWGVVVSGVASILNLAGFDTGALDQGEVTGYILEAINIGGLGLALWGRMSASKSITGIVRKKAA